MNCKEIIEANRDLQIQTLQDLVSIKSVVSNPVTNEKGEYFPFGQGVQDAFACFLKTAEAFGFETKNVDNYGGHVDFGSGDYRKGDPIVAVLGHLDVVPEGDGWSFDPYSGAVSDEYIYGRGTLDDKGPMVAALFAMKALKESGYVPKVRVRMILGLDEETNWDGMKYYFEKEPMPSYGFTPDAEFPALNGEKGMMNFEIAKKLTKHQGAGLSLSSLTGGSAANMVPQHARAVVYSSDSAVYAHIRELAEDFRTSTGYSLKVKGTGKSLEITAEGKSAHGATPEAGLNAISVMMAFLGRLNFGADDLNVFFDFYNKYIGFDVNGQNLGCGFSDGESGRLTLNAGVIRYDKESITLNINIRYPVTFTEEQVYEAVMPLLDCYGMGLIKLGGKAPIYLPPDSPMIRTLMDVYRENTGDYESEPLVIGGGTYAKAAKNIVAFGGLFPGDPDLMHQKDERISIERMMTMTKIYADAIYKLSQENFERMEEA